MQSDLFQNILITSPIIHNKGTFNLKTQLGLANQPPSETLWQAKSVNSTHAHTTHATYVVLKKDYKVQQGNRTGCHVAN